ncbi:MAG: DUF2232 domain-containing protein [Candidatus Riflebacteria bacterium]|nr:DUF2232 domain-containing protein [Candidatus Riflebacteria bacterium]
MNSESTIGRGANICIMALLTSIIVFASGFMPLFGTVLLALSAVPGFLVLLANGIPWFCGYGLLTIFSMSRIGGWSAALMLIPMLLIPAGFFAFLIRSGIDTFKSFFISLTISCFFSLSFWMISPVMGDAGVEMWKQAEYLNVWAQSFEKAVIEKVESIENVKVRESYIDAMPIFLNEAREWFEFLGCLIPFSFFFGWHFFSLLLISLVGWKLSRKYAVSFEPLPDFSTWKFDWKLIWLFVAGWVMYYSADSLFNPSLSHLAKVVGANFLAISKFLYMVMGFSLLFWLFETYKLGVPNRIGLSLLAVLFNQLLVWFGIIDIWADFRAAAAKKPGISETDDDDSFF